MALTMTLAEIAAAVGGALHGADPYAMVTGRCMFDSRSAQPGSLFVDLHGARVDGHDFAHRPARWPVLTVRPLGLPAIEVDKPLVAYGHLGAAVVQRLPASGCSA